MQPIDSTRPSGPVMTSTYQSWSVQINAAPLPDDLTELLQLKTARCKSMQRAVHWSESGWPDLNRRLPAPKAGALAKLSYTPFVQQYLTA